MAEAKLDLCPHCKCLRPLQVKGNRKFPCEGCVAKEKARKPRHGVKAKKRDD